MVKFRVLLLLHELDNTGAPKVALDAFEELHGAVDLMTITVKSGELANRCRQLGELYMLMDYAVPTKESSLSAQMRYGVKRIVSESNWRRIGLIIKRWKPDVIYVNSVASFPLAKQLSLPAVPAILHTHELNRDLSRSDRHHGRLLRHWPRKYIAVSEAVRRVLIDNYGVTTEQIALIHEFVRSQDFFSSAGTGMVGKDDRFVVGGAGNPGWHKGLELWLLMASEVKRTLGEERVRFVWVGVRDNEIGWQFREMARKLNLDSCIEFVPSTSRPLECFANYDVFALTSWEDSCPIVVLENMMLEKPVLCFAGGGGAPEEVGETGIVIEDFSSQAMASAIVQLADAPERRLALGRAARARVRDNFVSSVQAPKILKEIEELAKAS